VASHDASRTGAPLLLLTVLRWLRRETDARLSLVLWRGGPLVDAFGDVADDLTVLHPPPGRRSTAETLELGLDAVGLGAVGRAATGARVRARLRVAEHDVLYLNGAGSALVAPHLRSGAPALAHVHELTRGLQASLQGAGRERFLGADRVVAVSRRVADLLVEAWAVDPERVVVRPGCLPDRLGGPAVEPDVADGAPLVLAVGAGSWRKGVDLFLLAAAAVRRAAPGPVRFAWVGPLDDEAAVRADASRLGLDDVLDLPGEAADPGPWFRRASVFVSTAREDPFPLVALEAGEAGLPVVAFDSGGIAELLADGRGTVVGPMDVPALAEAVAGVLRDGDGGAGGRLAAEVAARHTIDVLGPALWADLRAVAAG
jgi:glycosyltransferase involved in cell wall biosynthesis